MGAKADTAEVSSKRFKYIFMIGSVSIGLMAVVVVKLHLTRISVVGEQLRLFRRVDV